MRSLTTSLRATHRRSMSTCVLEDPRHIVVFAVDGRMVVVQNRLFDIDPESASRVIRSIFRALPRVRRILIEPVKTRPPRDAPADSSHWRQLEHGRRPAGRPREVPRGLGQNTRQKLRRYFEAVRRRPSRRTPSARLVQARSIPPFVHRIVEMNRQRMASKGWVSSYRDEDEAFLLERARRHGFALAITIDGTIVAGTL